MPVKRFIYAAIDNRTDLPNLAAYPEGGIDGAPLQAVGFRDIAAVVSDLEVSQFALSQAPESQQAQLLKYQQVNAYLLGQTKATGMLPLKFGFTASDDAEVAKVLEQAYVQLRSYLDRLQGTMELVIQATWELPKILQAFVQDNPEIALADPAEAGKRLFEAAEGKKRSLVAAIQATLGPLAKDYADAPLTAETMIINRSYLVDMDQEASFDDGVDAVATEFEDLLTFRYIGPLPVYSFVNIELNQGNFALLDRSRKLLELPETSTWEAVKSAYRQLILAHHPDKNPDDPQAAQRTKDIVAAFEMVRAYGQSLPGFGEAEFAVSFAKEAVEQALIVDDKGAIRATGAENPR